VVDQVQKEYGAQIEWLPFLLRPDMPEGGQEVPAHIRAKVAQSGDRLKRMAEMQGLQMATTTWIPNPRLAHEATEYAREQGKGLEFHRVVFRRYYGENQDIGNWDILRSAAIEVGLDADAMQNAVDSDQYRQAFDEQIADAQSIGVNSVPTYVVNDRYAIVGAQPFAVFKQVIERLQSDSSRSAPAS
jgi:predicted DsbA family dithiol-disulfide isomerase